jgi:hypothetical protein
VRGFNVIYTDLSLDAQVRLLDTVKTQWRAMVAERLNSGVLWSIKA